MRIKIVTESAEAFAELNNTKTASAVFDSLPIESVAHRWGEEVYFEIPLDVEPENGKEVLEVGDIAYWSPGRSMCIFFGPTPSSRGNEVRAYSPVNVFGKISGDATIFRDVKEGDLIRVETGD
ncbi:MAG TPA: cyclophilin-like fold protein [Candidatus Methanoperedens sp.]|nr:cyclophilin-like fold protein [Candidatus Methanoperedens sp.]HLB70308.1 cyclophilin-like fold protein [Candidatus Methanoperedens sp.]